MKIPLFLKKFGGYEDIIIYKKKAVYENTFRSQSRSRKSVIVSAPAPAKKGGSGSATLFFTPFILAAFYATRIRFLRHDVDSDPVRKCGSTTLVYCIFFVSSSKSIRQKFPCT